MARLSGKSAACGCSQTKSKMPSAVQTRPKPSDSSGFGLEL